MVDVVFGKKIARYDGDRYILVLNVGVKKEFVNRYNVSEVMKDNHLTDEKIVADVLAVMK